MRTCVCVCACTCVHVCVCVHVRTHMYVIWCAEQVNIYIHSHTLTVVPCINVPCMFLLGVASVVTIGTDPLFSMSGR